ncbi:MAG: heme A synthase [Bacteroidetes bacterium]|nr:MAG: heme A synthase [Bacteroidota bacterium]
MTSLRLNRFAVYAWSVLGYLLLVILWGAFVRATGAGAGCGSHWPLCNGEVIPRAPEVETLIEFSHRLTSALAGFLVIGLLVWAFRAYPRGHRVRRGAFWTFVFILTEGAIGAVIVLFEWVAFDASLARTISIALHLNNTFILVAFLTLTAWWASGGLPMDRDRMRRYGWLLGALVLGMLLVSTMGAITALGDTLFRAGSTAEALARSRDAAAHHLEQLRVYHPLLALMLVLALVPVVRHIARLQPDPLTTRLGGIMTGLYIGQLLLGLLNIYLKAPVWMQLTHLLVADAIWITLILFCNTALAARPAPAQPAPAASPAQAASPALRTP